MLNKNLHNPDVLNTLANLSNDEVFTPPLIVNKVLDQIPINLWKDPNIKFLDPVSKSGVFLREIAKRLNIGLKDIIKNEEKRLNHIFNNQVYGLAITELTALISRRSLYYSKIANDKKFSACTSFNNSDGNIIFYQSKHIWDKNGQCKYCGASKLVYDRGKEYESHAYDFIHQNKIFSNMKFDVIVGNPPYQLNDGGHGTSAKPIYQLFVEQAKKLEPRYLSMIIPSRWFSGGKGLDKFREEMLTDRRLTKLVDYFDSTECFPNVDISGGVCYFLWEKNREDDCEVKSIQKGEINILKRPLLEKNSSSFIRFNDAISIYKKILKNSDNYFDKIVSERRPFNLDTNIKLNKKKLNNYIKCFAYPNNGYVKLSDIKKNLSLVYQNKIFVAKAYGERGEFPYRVIAKPFLGTQNTCSTETYLAVGPFKNRKETLNALSYMKTKFFRFFVLLKKNTQNAAKGVYSLVPLVNFNESWDDKKLNIKFKLNPSEVEFINSLVKPMEDD